MRGHVGVLGAPWVAQVRGHLCLVAERTDSKEISHVRFCGY